jgi:uncharacterized protein YbjT (DUF2867 family)
VILVTGAGGTIGSRIAARLADGTEPVRLLSRRLRASAQQDVVAADFDDPAALRRAFHGVRAAFVVTSDPRHPEHDANIVDAARRAGTEHLVKVSTLSVEDDSAQDLVTCWQRASETVVRNSGLGWTLLRPRAFMTNTLSWRDAIHRDGTVPVLHPDAPVACVDPDDIAAVAVLALTRPGHRGRIHQLTGPAALSARDQVGTLAEVLQRPIAVKELTEEQARHHLLHRYPPAIAEALLHSSRRQAAGDKVRVASTVPDLLGRSARAYNTWAAAHRTYFAAPHVPVGPTPVR